MSGIFEKYIPKFEYELISLNEYGIDDLTRFGDTLSLIMILDKIKAPDGIKILSKLPADYIERLALNIPERLKKLIADVVTVLLTKINVQKEEIEGIVGKIEERGIQEMFAIENYDVQETRRVAKNEGRIEGKIEGKIEGEIEAAVKIIASLKITVSEAMRVLELPKKEQKKIVKELEKRNIPYVVGQ